MMNFPSLRIKPKTTTRRFIVTGGAGFIGSHIVEALLKEPDTEVIVIDDFSAGLMDNLPRSERLSILEYNIATEYMWLERRAEQLKDVDGVFHLAADARIQPSISDPTKTFNSNVLGTFNLLQLMQKIGCKNIVYSASSSSYGLKNAPPLRENMSSDCLNPYAVTKMMGEELCKTWGKCYGINSICLKYFNVYGPRSPVHLGSYSPVIGLFFEQVLTGKEITVVGDGTQTRDFTYIEDVVSANLAAMFDLIESGPAARGNGRTLNIGTGHSVSIMVLARKIQALCFDVMPHSYIRRIACRPGEATDTRAFIALAKICLGWEPRVSLDEALQKLKPYYMEQFGVRNRQAD